MKHPNGHLHIFLEPIQSGLIYDFRIKEMKGNMAISSLMEPDLLEEFENLKFLNLKGIIIK